MSAVVLGRASLRAGFEMQIVAGNVTGSWPRSSADRYVDSVSTLTLQNYGCTAAVTIGVFLCAIKPFDFPRERRMIRRFRCVRC